MGYKIEGKLSEISVLGQEIDNMAIVFNLH